MAAAAVKGAVTEVAAATTVAVVAVVAVVVEVAVAAAFNEVGAPVLALYTVSAHPIKRCGGRQHRKARAGREAGWKTGGQMAILRQVR